MLPRFVIGICLLPLAVSFASAQTIYKCVEGGKTTYTSTPCGGAPSKELYYPVPTAEELRQGEVRRQAAQQELNDSFERKRASDEAYYRARSEAEANRAAYEASQPRVGPRDNEKIMVHTPSGWDYKTRAQIIAEEEAKAARRASRPRAVPTPDDSSRTKANSPPPPTLTDQTGKVWQNHGGTAYDPTTNRRCVVAGNVLVNCH